VSIAFALSGAVPAAVPAALSAAAVFAGTNVDDLLVLTVLFLGARASSRARIWAGQYLGIAALTATSVLAASGLAVLPDRWVRLLGLVPLALGLHGLAKAIRHRTRHRSNGHTAPAAAPIAAPGALAVAGITIANGGDNIAVYTPLFRAAGPMATAVTVAVFAAGVALWCLAAGWLGSRPAVVRALERTGPWLVPAAFVAISLWILLG
jgi:cadmium resistance protein CadD (predicted permease)